MYKEEQRLKLLVREGERKLRNLKKGGKHLTKSKYHAF